MDVCCETKAEEIKTLRGKHKNVLTVVLVINAVLFVVEAAVGLVAHSTALLADSLDMLGDALVYGFSLYALWRSAEWKAAAAVLKGAIMAVFGVGVLIEAVYKAIAGVVPMAETIGIIGMLVLLWVVFFSTLPPSFRRSQYALDLAMLPKRYSRKSLGTNSCGRRKSFGF